MKETYKNILELITVNENIKYNCQNNLRSIEQLFLRYGPKGYSKGTSYLDADCVHGSKLDIDYTELQRLTMVSEKLKAMIELQTSILAGLYESKNKIDNTLRSLTGIEYDVAYLKLVEGCSLKEIADKLHISDSYCMKISSKI